MVTSKRSAVFILEDLLTHKKERAKYTAKTL